MDEKPVDPKEEFKQELIESIKDMEAPPAKTSNGINIFCFIIGVMVAWYSIKMIIESFEINSIMLILTGPIAIVFLIIPLKNWFPRLKGVIYIFFGLLLGSGYVIINWRIMKHVLFQVGIAVIIGLIMVIYGYTQLESVKRKTKAEYKEILRKMQ